MHQVTVSRIVGAPIEDTWRTVADFGGVFRYHPMVEASPITGEHVSGNGAERTCHFHGGGSIGERVRDFDAGRGYGIEITDPGSFPLKEGLGRIDLEAASPDTTRVDFTMRFTPRFGPLGWVMAKTMMKPQFRRILGGVLEGLDTHLRTGAIVGPKGRLTAA